MDSVEGCLLNLDFLYQNFSVNTDYSHKSHYAHSEDNRYKEDPKTFLNALHYPRISVWWVDIVNKLVGGEDRSQNLGQGASEEEWKPGIRTIVWGRMKGEDCVEQTQIGQNQMW